MQEHWSMWLGVALAVGLFIIAVGVWIGRSYLGILIDSRGKMSLARLQVVLWTWLLVSSFFAVAWTKKTMEIELPAELWALMGISMGSVAGAVMIKATKAAKIPDATKLSPETMEVRRMGLLHVNQDPKDAKLSDLFTGDDIVNRKYVDVSKVQMFFFTLAAWLGYIAALWGASLMPEPGGALMFPELSASLVTLIGISHAGYLTVKAVPTTPSAS